MFKYTRSGDVIPYPFIKNSSSEWVIHKEHASRFRQRVWLQHTSQSGRCRCASESRCWCGCSRYVARLQKVTSHQGRDRRKQFVLKIVNLTVAFFCDKRVSFLLQNLEVVFSVRDRRILFFRIILYLITEVVRLCENISLYSICFCIQVIKPLFFLTIQSQKQLLVVANCYLQMSSVSDKNSQKCDFFL